MSLLEPIMEFVGINVGSVTLLLLVVGVWLYRVLAVGKRLSTAVFVGSAFMVGLSVLVGLGIVEPQPEVAMNLVDGLVDVATAIIDAVLGSGGGETA